MMRHCDGKDPNLIAYVDPDGNKLDRGSEKTIPCDCGCVFDDVDRRVIWPHHLV